MDRLCVAPGTLREGDLLAYLDGEAPAEVAGHIARCPACAAELAALSQTAALVHAAFFREDCPEPEELLQHQAGLLAPEGSGRVRVHAAVCRDCQAELAEIAQVEPVPRSSPAPGGLLRRMGAALLQAARVAPAQPAPALRGASTSGHYRAGPYLVIVALTPPPLPEAGWQLEGQISHSDGPEALAQGGEALLLRGESILLRDQIDETGFFTLDPIQPGVYLLELALPDARISIPDLTII